MPARVGKVIRVCAQCGAAFAIYPSHLKRPGRGTYCSKECGGAAKRSGGTLQCAMCDGEFYRANAEQDPGVKVNQFCSRQCYTDWRVLNTKSSTYRKVGARHRHRIVAEAVLGRSLNPGEVVHHIDEDKHNNHPTNLAVLPSQSDHMRCHQGNMSDAELRRFRLA